jgi:acetyltransferase
VTATADTARVIEAAFHPRSIAIVGVPRGPRLGRGFLEAQLDAGFRGPIYAVNPAADEILGVRAYPSVSAIGEPIDLAIIVTPPDAVAGVVTELGSAGVPVAHVFTSGFGELGSPEGDARNEALLNAARAAGVRLIGPNCMGIFSPRMGVAPFANMPREAGDVAFISQSGSLMSMFAREAHTRGVPAAKAVSSGNQLDLQATDFLRAFAADPEVACIGLYVEGARDGRAFFEALREAARAKPVVLWKAGRTRGGTRAVQSHTGSLAGTAELWAAVARQAGALQVRDSLELMDTIVALHLRPRFTGNGVAVVTAPGGPSVSAVDALEEAGLELATLAGDTIAALRAEIAPVGTSPRNPVDLGLGGGGAEAYASAIRIASGDPAVDAVVVIGGGGRGERAADFADALIEVASAAKAPLVLAGSIEDVELVHRYAAAGVGVFPTAERAVRALANARRDAAFRASIE